MFRLWFVLCCAAGLAQAADPSAKAVEFPANVRKLMSDADQDVEKARKKFQAEELAIKNKLVADLQKLLDAETKKGNLDGALAIRGAIEQIKLNNLKAPAAEDPVFIAAKKMLVGGKWAFVVLGTPYHANWEFKDDGTFVNSDAGSADKKWSAVTINKVPVLRVGSCVFQLTPNAQKLQGVKTTSNEKVELTRVGK